jgi:NAD(P)-dependent dehydrogenase (short-subunit alcohol dehydrogenase family)
MSVNIDYTGKVVLVTGGTKGLGRGIARRFEEAGATVAVCARNPVNDLPATWTFVAADLRSGTGAFGAIDEVIARCGQLDVLVNNAGGGPLVETETASPSLTEKIIALNLNSAMFCSQRAYQQMKTQPTGGSIINIASVCATRQSPMSAAYGAAKAGLVNYTATIGHEWAPVVRSNAVIVGLVRTELSHVYYGDEAGIARVAETIPLGHLAEPEEIANICLFLGSPLASYVTGSTVNATGGGDRPAFLDAANG